LDCQSPSESRRFNQQAVTNCDHLRRLKYSPILPYAFTEHGAVMPLTSGLQYLASASAPA